MTAQAIALDDMDVSFQYPGERRLWAAALRFLIDDAKRHWQGRRLHLNPTDDDGIDAFDDLVACGPMLRHCCLWLDVEPEAVSRSFLRWCEQDCVHLPLTQRNPHG